MCTPGADEPVVTTSNRAAPPLPSIETEALYRARKAILAAIPMNAMDRSLEELKLVMVVRYLISGRSYFEKDIQWAELSHIADLLGIDLPSRTDEGEAPR